MNTATDQLVQNIRTAAGQITQWETDGWIYDYTSGEWFTQRNDWIDFAERWANYRLTHGESIHIHDLARAIYRAQHGRLHGFRWFKYIGIARALLLACRLQAVIPRDGARQIERDGELVDVQIKEARARGG